MKTLTEWREKVNTRAQIKPAFGWMVVLLTLTAAATILACDLHQRKDLTLMWFIFLVLGVLVHEFGHAFLSKLRGHNIKEPAVLWLRISNKNLLGFVLLGLAAQSLIGAMVLVGETILMAWGHPSAGWLIAGRGLGVAWTEVTALPLPSLGLLAVAIVIWRLHTDSAVWNWSIKLPLGVGMHTTHQYRDISDIVAGVTGEAILWTLLGFLLFPVMLWMALLTILVNIVVPFKLRGEGNDAVCMWREQLARWRGYAGITEV